MKNEQNRALGRIQPYFLGYLKIYLTLENYLIITIILYCIYNILLLYISNTRFIRIAVYPTYNLFHLCLVLKRKEGIDKLEQKQLESE